MQNMSAATRKTSSKAKDTRISARVREAVRLMVEEGRKRPEAAQAVGLKDDSLYRALLRPDVCELRTELMQVKRTNAAARTIARAEHLADHAQSEHVRLQANEWLGGIAGVVPIQRHEGRFEHDHTGLTPGLKIEFRHRTTPELVQMVRDYIAANPNSAGATAAIEQLGTTLLMGNGQPMPEPVPHPAQLAHIKPEVDG
jgi:hypothetical protein